MLTNNYDMMNYDMMNQDITKVLMIIYILSLHQVMIHLHRKTLSDDDTIFLGHKH
jgi:hypothetical protein